MYVSISFQSSVPMLHVAAAYVEILWGGSPDPQRHKIARSITSRDPQCHKMARSTTSPDPQCHKIARSITSRDPQCHKIARPTTF